MEYICRMTTGMYWRTIADSYDCGMSVEEYITATFGLRGKCVKAEIG